MTLLVVLIFTYLAGAVTGVMGAAYWRKITTHKEETEAPLPPPPVPDPIYQVERIGVVVPPEFIRVGVGPACYAYHDVNNTERCREMIDMVRRNPGAKVTKKFQACQKCFPEGTYPTADLDAYFALNGLPRGARPRRTRPQRGNVALQVND